jgi:hypothetical protein
MSTFGPAGQRPVWLSVGDAARCVGFGRNTIDRAIDLGALPSRHTLDKRRVVAQADAELFRAKLLRLAKDEGLGDGQ